MLNYLIKLFTIIPMLICITGYTKESPKINYNIIPLKNIIYANKRNDCLNLNFILFKKNNPDAEIIAQKYYYLNDKDNTKVLVLIYNNNKYKSNICFISKYATNITALAISPNFEFANTSIEIVKGESETKVKTILYNTDTKEYYEYKTAFEFKNNNGIVDSTIKIESDKIDTKSIV